MPIIVIISVIAFFIAGPAILVLSLVFSRRWLPLVIGGIIAGTIMILEYKFAISMAGIGSATSGHQSGYDQARRLGFVFCGSFIAYIILALMKLAKIRKSKFR